MSSRKAPALILAALAASAALGLAGAAWAADPASKAADFTVRTETTAMPLQAGKTLKWDARRGRWGVTLNLDQPNDRDAQWNDIQAGAYYRLTPQLRVGGAVALGDKFTLSNKATSPLETAPRVRLETAFKF